MKEEKYFQKHIDTIPNFPKEGIMFRDITPTIENAEAFRNAIDTMAELIKDLDFNKIICADARGFLFGAALSYKLGKDLVLSRKPGKLPRPQFSYSYTLEYGNNSLEISDGSIQEGDRVLAVDDLLATGGSALAMMKLVEMAKGTNVGAIFYIELIDLKGEDAIKKEFDIPVISLVKYKGE